MICRLQLIQLLSTVCSVPSPRRGFSGLSPPNKAPSPQIGKWNTTVYQWSFCQFLEYQAPRTNAKLPYWKLSSDGFESAAYSSFVHKKTNLTQIKQEFKYLRAQWHSHPKILYGSKCLILGEQRYFVLDIAS